ncbi:inorganic polyphosphate kinase [Streptomyces sp. NRRL B-1347]|uniref:inorganic polyphosphate kinase n=1 Tax=Streptomyces sp. NRRL B-1347 TaxID=1476877 RepID=UPI0004CBD3C6|nr:inorganic polyphosphate kinase [Streptomyces sp. NRRL B-1347]
MSLAPRAVLVHRRTEYEELVARHGTHGHAAFFLTSRGRAIEEVAERHRRTHRALADVAAAVPLRWRHTRVERADLDRFLFAPEDVVVVVGQDGLVANAAKYLTGQPVIGVDAEPGRNPGVLVRHRPADTAKLLPHAAAGAAGAAELTMAEAVTDDGQRLRALNEIYVGAAGHQTARYRLSSAAGPSDPPDPSSPSGPEAQASSGVVIGTGTGATGWLRSLWQQSADGPGLPGATDPRLLWFVREAWPSPATGTSLVRGELLSGQRLWLTAESDRLVAFGDGMEHDALELGWGQSVRVGVAEGALRLVA